ncbi:hypothetical protein GGR52DRAFT_570503 [Hypoxylon sp. FL1284]|nr:hypothetical protein GGR52DRAFT_570503 [Hypoxylon sp. FL1284]
MPPGSQAGRIFIVTGGNSGIGLELCKLLLGSEATMYVASEARSEKAEAAIASIATEKKGQQGTGSFKFLHLDLGIGANGVEFGGLTTQGHEVLLGTHCIGALFFTELLYPKLKAAADADVDVKSSDSAPSGRTRVV